MTFSDKLSQLATSMFLHGGWAHVISNLWIPRSSVVARGQARDLRYLFLYLLSGFISGGCSCS